METTVFQLYVTDIWGSHASRENLGIFSSVQNALYSLVADANAECPDTNLLKEILLNRDSRLFIEQSEIDVKDSESQVFDSSNDGSLNELKRIVFFHNVETFKNNLEFFHVDEDDIDFDMSEIQNLEDVTDDLLETYLGEDNIKNFVEHNV